MSRWRGSMKKRRGRRAGGARSVHCRASWWAAAWRTAMAFPMSIEGSAPSIVQANATQFLFNRPQSYRGGAGQGEMRAAPASRCQPSATKWPTATASLYLDAERAARIGGAGAQGRREPAAGAGRRFRRRCGKGRALPLAEKQAAYNLARARQAGRTLDDDQATAETALAIALGFSARGPRPAGGGGARPRRRCRNPKMQAIAVGARIQQGTAPAGIADRRQGPGDARREGAPACPRVDLVAQYALLAKFNNYAEFFQQVPAQQRANRRVVPIAAVQRPGRERADGARRRPTSTASEDATEPTRATASASDLQQAFRDVKKAETAAEVARLDLEVAREQLAVDLAQMQEGRAALRQVEEARVAGERQVDRVLRRAIRRGKGAVERAAADGGSGGVDRGDAVKKTEWAADERR